MSLADTFNTDAFSMISLTNSILKLPFMPQRIQQMNLFQPKGITTTTAVIEEKAGTLELVMSAKRGAPASLGKEAKRTVRSFVIPHLPIEDTILAESIQDVRAFGSENAQQGIASVVNERLTAMKNNIMVTIEHMYAKTLQGKLLDADGTELFDFFSEFGITETTEDFKLGTSTEDIRQHCMDVIDAIEEALGAGAYQHIHALCGKSWFEDFINADNVKAAYVRFQDGAMLRNDVRKGFEFAGITFEQYRGVVSSQSFIPSTVARFFPVGVTDLFVTSYAPADFIETVNTVGKPMYAKQRILDYDKGIELHAQSNPLPMCTRPAVLVKGTTST